ncbi:MAG: hypothetical protein CMJ94_15380 [Planctomycetes bacterium]|nr:hypothetical protein [Planctomycetota bacterium]
MIVRAFTTWAALSLGAQAQSAQFEPGQLFPSTPFVQAESGELAGVDAFLGEPLLLHIYASW